MRDQLVTAWKQVFTMLKIEASVEPDRNGILVKVGQTPMWISNACVDVLFDLPPWVSLMVVVFSVRDHSDNDGWLATLKKFVEKFVTTTLVESVQAVEDQRHAKYVSSRPKATVIKPVHCDGFQLKRSSTADKPAKRHAKE